MPDSIQTLLATFSAIVFAAVLAGLWLALRRAERHEAWKRSHAEARASRRLSERKDMRALATYAPEIRT